MALSEVVGAFSYALDLTEGQPEGHCIRACWIGMHLGEAIGLDQNQLWQLYYTILLKDLGCSSNAARVCTLYLGDDRALKRDFKLVAGGMGPALNFVFKHTGLKADLATRFRAIANLIANGDDLVTELIETRCQRGADIARQLRFSEAVAQGIQCLDEHWDGRGRPAGISGDAIPIYSQIALLSQVVDVFHTAAGRDAAETEIGDRSGSWFDPNLVRNFLALARNDALWEALGSNDLAERVLRLEPAQRLMAVTEDYLDDIAAAFGRVVDAKSPFTAGHSARVGAYVDLICEELGMEPAHRRWVKRGAILHDIGKLAVSNTLLDKPGRLEGEEWRLMMDHARHTGTILSRISAFEMMAPVAAAHHERLDGKGYPFCLQGEEICFETRIISVADFFDALTADRPYRAAVPVDRSLQIMAENVGSAIDPIMFEALKAGLRRIGGNPISQAGDESKQQPEGSLSQPAQALAR